MTFTWTPSGIAILTYSSCWAGNVTPGELDECRYDMRTRYDIIYITSRVSNYSNFKPTFYLLEPAGSPGGLARRRAECG
jgi:hypothetical protein